MTNNNITENEEVWKPVVDYENFYEISSLGRIRSLDTIINFRTKNGLYRRRKNIGRVLVLSYDSGGYLIVCLCVSSVRRTLLVHRLVGLTFILNPLNKPQINHINGIRHDNRIENLEWNTRSENQSHSFRELNRKQSGTPPRAIKGVNENGVIFFPSFRAATQAGFNRSHIHYCITGTGNREMHKGYKWYYA